MAFEDGLSLILTGLGPSLPGVASNILSTAMTSLHTLGRRSLFVPPSLKLYRAPSLKKKYKSGDMG